MDFLPDPENERFRQEVRAFIAGALDPAIASRELEFRSARDPIVAWQRILHARGWGAPYWAAQDGGTGWTIPQQQIFDEECHAAGAPTLDIFGHKQIGPVLNAFGTPEQKRRFRDPIISGEQLWCQGFSEPGSGSDLASLRCRAERRGERYVVNGQKIWTSYAHQADWIFLLVRTDGGEKKQAGISMLLVDMRSAGVTTKPIVTIDNRHHLNEVFFDNVEVPVTDRVGDEGSGWKITKFLLNNEHASTAELPSLHAYLRRLKVIARAQACGGVALAQRPEFRLRVARFEAEVNAIAMLVARVAALEQARDHSPQAHVLGSVLKLRGTELLQSLSTFLVESLGEHGAVSYIDPPGQERPHALPLQALAGDVAADAFFRRASTIYGGTSEVQRGIVARLRFEFS